MRSNEIPVLFCSNRPYCQHMAVAIASLLFNNPDRPFRIYVALTEEAEEEKSRIQQIVHEYPHASIVFRTYDRSNIVGFPSNSHITVDAYVRVFLTELVDPDVERLLYLDCDLIVCSEIDELWRIDLGGRILGAVQDAFSDNHQALGFTDEEPYYNSGVLLIDVKKWREADLTADLVAFIRQNPLVLRYLDQDAFNAVLRGQIRSLPLKWNFTPRHADAEPEAIGISRREFMSIRRKPGIVHFASGFKPWYYGFEPHYKSWYYRYRALTPWNDRPAQPAGHHAANRSKAIAERVKAMFKWHFPYLVSLVRRWTGFGDPCLQPKYAAKRSLGA